MATFNLGASRVSRNPLEDEANAILAARTNRPISYSGVGGAGGTGGAAPQYTPTGSPMQAPSNAGQPMPAANPYAGQVYLEGGWSRFVDQSQSDTGRVTFSTEFDAKKWGNYRFAALAEYEKGFSGSVNTEEFWIDAVTRQPAFNPIPENAQNYTYRRSYPIERDWATYHLNGPGRDRAGRLAMIRCGSARP